VVSKKRSSPNFSAQIISLLPEDRIFAEYRITFTRIYPSNYLIEAEVLHGTATKKLARKQKV